MESPWEARVESVDRLENGVLVTFEGGISAIFSSALLFSMLTQAERVVDDIETESEE
jgi:hypothetical protein